MSQQQSDPWATVYALWSITTHDGRGNATERLVYLKSEVDAARAEDAATINALRNQIIDLGARVEMADIEHRHAEELADLKGAHEAALAALGRSHAQALERLKAAHAEALEEARETITSLRAQLAAVQSPLVVYARHLRDLAQTLEDGAANPPAVEARWLSRWKTASRSR